VPPISAKKSPAGAVITAISTGDVQNPFPLYGALREMGEGVHWAEELGGWVCTRYDDVRRTCMKPSEFSNAYFFDLAGATHDPEIEAHRRYIEISSQQFMLSDPPEHTEIRAILRGTFSRRALNRWRLAICQVADELLDGLQPGMQIDAMSGFASRVPVAVIATMLGIPHVDTWRFQDWTEAFVNTFNPRTTGEVHEKEMNVALEMFDYLAVLAEKRRAEPADDLITLVSTATLANNEPLGVARVVAQLALLLAAGNETTANLIGNGITLLINKSEVQRRLRRQAALLPGAIEEMLRLDPPFHFDLRKATATTRLGNQQIEAGQLCYQLLASANRDPRQFENPEEFSLSRSPNPHLAFSHGIHFCLGAHLARLEGEIVFHKLLERFPRLAEGDEEPIRKTEQIMTRGWLTRPVKLLA
jgi:cytochrome P450